MVKDEKKEEKYRENSLGIVAFEVFAVLGAVMKFSH